MHVQKYVFNLDLRILSLVAYNYFKFHRAFNIGNWTSYTLVV